MRFEKWHALGNAYLLVEQPDAGAMTPERVRRLSDGDTGIGSDGVLEVTARHGAHAVVRIWNPDGSTAELSGNGTRIAAAWLLREEGAGEVEIETEGRLVRATPGIGKGMVTQDLGTVSVADDEVLDVAGERLTIVPVDVGNPHAVVLRYTLSRDDLLRLGPAIETHPRFPRRTNVQLAAPEPRDVVSVLVWERGAGETAGLGIVRRRRGRGGDRARLVLEPGPCDDAGRISRRHGLGGQCDARRPGRADLRRQHRALNAA